MVDFGGMGCGSRANESFSDCCSRLRLRACDISLRVQVVLLYGFWYPKNPQSPTKKEYLDPYRVVVSPRVQVPNNHILSKILTYITTILKPST